MDIMFLVVLSTIFLQFTPLTAAMIVIMSLLDDVPIMTIAYDHTPVSAGPIRWHMPRIIGVSAVLGLFSVVESFGLLLIGMRVLSHPQLQQSFGLTTHAQLQTVMFLQLVAGGHLLLFITRTERWFFLPPFAAPPLFSAILLTQVLAVLMCGLGWLVPAIAWRLVGWVWVYNLAWMVVLGGVRMVTEEFAAYRTARHVKSAALVNQPLQAHAAGVSA
jgi:H+-transporting ATPase